MKSEKINRIDIKEFREKGYLQEINRLFLHPLGLALEISIDDDGNETLGGIWDYRDDKEGIYYNLEDSSKERIERFDKNKDFIDSEFSKGIRSRRETLGFGIEPIPNKKD